MNPAATSTVSVTLNFPRATDNSFTLGCQSPSVVLSCTVVGTAVIAAGSSLGTGQVRISVSGTAARQSAPSLFGTEASTFLALCALLPFLVRKTRSQRFRAALLLTVLGAFVIGCSPGNFFDTPKASMVHGTYTITVTATNQGITVAAPLQVIVQ